MLIGYNVTVANLIPALQKKANEGVAADQLATESLRSDDAANIADMAQNKLYLKERGRGALHDREVGICADYMRSQNVFWPPQSVLQTS